MDLLTEKQAYAAMFEFLKRLYDLTKSDDLGGFLGSMSLLRDGVSADPAMINEWKKCVQFALDGGEAGLLTIAPVKK